MKRMGSGLLVLSTMAVCAVPAGAVETAAAESAPGTDVGAIVAIGIFVVVLAAGIFRISRSDRRDKGIDDK